MRRIREQGPLLVSVATLGLVAVLLFLQIGPRLSPVDNRRVDELFGLLLRVEQERDLLRDEVFRLREDLAVAARDQTTMSGLERELDRARMAAGLVAVTGPGIEVTLTDSKSELSAGEDPNRAIVHDEDILRVVNELAAAGAEAIAINGQRVVAMTEVRCVGPAISINNTRTAPPVVITAIGDPATLQSAVRLRGGVADLLALWGIGVSVVVTEELVIPAYAGTLMFRHAVPVSAGL